MTKLKSYIDFLRSFSAPLRSPGTDALAREQLIGFVDDGLQEAAKILIEAREPWMLTEWAFDVVSGQKVYPFYSSIAPGAVALKGAVNFVRASTLFIISQGGDEYVKYALTDKRRALLNARPLDPTPTPMAYIETRSGHGGASGTEGDLALVMENPPNYSAVGGGRLSVYIQPRPLASNEPDDWEPHVPPAADDFVRWHALSLCYLATGKNEQYRELRKQLADSEARLRAAVGTGISDDPQHVFDERSVEEGY